MRQDRIAASLPESRASARVQPRWRGYAGALLVVTACTLVALAMQPHFDPANLTMIYLLGVVVSAMAFGRGPAVFAAVTSVALFDFAFVPPRFTFRVTDTQYLVTFAVMLVVALVIGTLIAWLREQRELATQRELRATALHRLSRDLALRSSMKSGANPPLSTAPEFSASSSFRSTLPGAGGAP